MAIDKNFIKFEAIKKNINNPKIKNIELDPIFFVSIFII